MTPLLDPGDILDAASKVVELPGVWHRGSLGCNDVHGVPIRACAIGAIYQAAVGRVVAPPYDAAAYTACHQAALALARHVRVPIPHWNDTVAESADEVATAMREAAAVWRSQQTQPSR